MLWQLEALRGAAACYVAFGHLGRNAIASAFPSLDVLLAFGQEAVMAFFLLSGFVIHWSCAQKPALTFVDYLRARVLRLYPLFLLTLLLAFLFAPTGDPRAGWPVLLGNLLMLQDWSVAKPGVWFEVYAGTLVLWSLSYEWWFYLLYWPLARGCPARYQALAVGVFSVLGAAFCLWQPNQAARFAAYFVTWWLGVELARGFLRDQLRDCRPLVWPLLCVAAIALLFGAGVWRAHRAGAVLSFGLHPVLEFRHFLAVLLITGIALAWHRAGWTGYRFLLGVFIPVAPFGYAVYLLHEPLAVHWGPFNRLGSPWLALGGHLLLVAVAAWIAERYVQRLFRHLFLP